MKAVDDLPLRDLNDATRRATEGLLRAAGICDIDAVAWLDADTADPNFVGHEMWQIDAPGDDYIEIPFFGRRPNGLRRPPIPSNSKKRLIIAGADFGGLMKVIRITFGQMLFQSELIGANFFHDDSLFDLHRMSTVIYLSTASDRIREIFVTAVFDRTKSEYEKRGNYEQSNRKEYSTPFVESMATVGKFNQEILTQCKNLIPMSAEISEFRKSRNTIIHEIATGIGRLEGDLLERNSKSTNEEIDSESFAEWEPQRRLLESAHKARISDTIRDLKKWYFLLLDASNEVFIIEHKLRHPRLTKADK